MEIDFLNPRSIICLIAILQGLVFAAMLVFRYRREGQRSDLWLAALLGAMCLALVTPMIGFANVYDLNQWLTYFPFGIAYSYGVLVWIYTVHLTDSQRRLRRRELLYFVPAACYLLLRFYLFAHDLEWKGRFGREYGRLLDSAIFITELGWNLTFLALSIRHYRLYRTWLDENFSDTEKIKFDWLRNFLYVFTAILATGAVFDFVNGFVVRLSYIQYFYFEVLLALATYSLAVAGYLRSRTISIEFEPGTASGLEPRKPVGGEDLARLADTVRHLMDTEKPYLDPQLTLADLARRAGVNANALSFVINSAFGRNFNDFVNEYRVGEVKRRFRKGSGTILGTAFDCGFNSKATFNRAFKKFAGATPMEYFRTGETEAE